MSAGIIETSLSMQSIALVWKAKLAAVYGKYVQKLTYDRHVANFTEVCL